MPDPLLLPTIAALSGGSLLFRDYLKHRLEGSEDRYMALYGKDQWDASNMDLTLHVAPDEDAAFKEAFVARLAEHLGRPDRDTTLLREEAQLDGAHLAFTARAEIDTDVLLQPRHGVWFDLGEPGKVRVVWNHMQTDGVGMWEALRPLFDPNPPIVPFRDVEAPPPLLPELLALPKVARQLVWRGRLRGEPESEALVRGLAVWDAAALRQTRERLGAPFNLLTSAVAVAAVLRRHPEKPAINVGLTAYFPFLEGRNRYGVFLCRVRRGTLAEIVAQLVRQTRSPVLNWGAQAAQSYALGRVPDRVFAKLVSYYRRQVDVLVSSLPVGQEPVTLAGHPTVISCHPWELTLPYYFLLVGTRAELDVSYTSRFPQDEAFLGLDGLIDG